MLMQCVRNALWAPTLVFLAHLFLSRGIGAYGVLPWLDKPVHLLGGAAIAYFFDCSLGILEEHGMLEAMGDRVRWLLAATLTASATIVWEFAEYTTDRLGWTRAQAGLEDTLGDMALGLLGGLMWLWARSARRRLPPRE